MNVLQIVAEKKKALKQAMEDRADSRMFLQMNQIDAIHAERERAEQRALIEEQLRQEKAELRKIKHQKLKNILVGVGEGMKEINQRMDERKNEGKGIFAK